MGYSVTGIMMHNILGITLAGSDICGFLGNTTSELCARWHVVGSFYPFSRNHNTLGSPNQEPWIYNQTFYPEKSFTYTDIMRHAINVKYSLIRFYYSEMVQISVDGGALYRPMYFDFPNDMKAYENTTNNIMLGASGGKAKVSVNALSDANTTAFYFPEGVWCAVFNSTRETASCITGPKTEMLDTRAYQYDMHLRDGSIIPMQDAEHLKTNTSKDLQSMPVDFHIHPHCASDNTCIAQYTYLNDDGNTTDITARNLYNMVLTSSKSVDSFTLTITHKNKTSSPSNF